jgi:HMG (high mobility group) box
MEQKPKQAVPSYLLFLSSVREQIKLENPNFTVRQVAVRGGEMWRALADKTQWENQAAANQLEYRKRLNAWRQAELERLYGPERSE